MPSAGRRKCRAASPVKYALPPYLDGVCSLPKYRKWLECKADDIQKRDRKSCRYDRPFSQAYYKEKLHEAVMKSSGHDPFTGEELRWDLIGTKQEIALYLARKAMLSGKHAVGPVAIYDEYMLMPVADHVDPHADEPCFEICSWIVNESKSVLDSKKYVELCRKVAKYSAGKMPDRRRKLF
jgi:hypothetical protein